MGVGKYVVKRTVAPDPVYAQGVFAPAGWGADWRAYRDGGAATERREVPILGDSTTFGAGGNYSYVQRVRDRSIAAGHTDGGKGIFGRDESGITYDAPEVNGFVSSTFTGSPSAHDSLVGQYYYSSAAGQTLTLRARSAGFRIWYVDRPDAGSFTYAVDGGAPVVVECSTRTGGDPLDRFVYVSGLSADTAHTVVITNRGGRGTPVAGSYPAVYIALAPVNGVGIVYQKQATSGATIQGFFHEPPDTDYTGNHLATRYQAPLGLAPTSGAGSPTSADGYVAGNAVDTGYPVEARVRPILAMFNLGFNDLSTQASTDYSKFTEGIRKFAAACRTTGCDGIVSTGNMPVNANWPTYGAGVYSAMKNQAATEGLAFVDMWEPFGGALAYTGGTADPHLTKAKYVQQGDYLWDGLLSV